jgi:hypothetical protein
LSVIQPIRCGPNGWIIQRQCPGLLAKTRRLQGARHRALHERGEAHRG